MYAARLQFADLYAFKTVSLSVNCLIPAGIMVASVLFHFFFFFVPVFFLNKHNWKNTILCVCSFVSQCVCIGRKKIPFPTDVTRSLFTWVEILGHRCSLLLRNPPSSGNVTKLFKILGKYVPAVRRWTERWMERKRKRKAANKSLPSVF